MKSTAVFLLALATRACAQCPAGTPFAGTGGVSCFVNECDGASCMDRQISRAAVCSVDPCQGCGAIWTLTRNGNPRVVTDRCSPSTTTAAAEQTERQCQNGMCPGIYRPVCTTECNQYPNSCSALDCQWREDQINDGPCADDCVAATPSPPTTPPPTVPPTRGSAGCFGITCPAGRGCDGRMCNRMLNRTCAGGISYSNPCHALSCGFEERDISIGNCPRTTVTPPTTQMCGEMMCPGVWDPVCGTNGVTYSNACQAQNCRTDVAFSGTCDVTIAPPITRPPPPPTANCPVCSPVPPQPGCWYDHSDTTRRDDGCLVYPCGQLMCSSTTAPDARTRGPPGEVCISADRQCPQVRCAAPPRGCEFVSADRLPNIWDSSGTQCCVCMNCAMQLRATGGQCPGYPIADSCGVAWPTVAPSTDAPTFPRQTFSPTRAPTHSEPTLSPSQGFGLSSCGASTAPRIQTAAADAGYYNNALAPVVIPAFADSGCSTLADAFMGYQVASEVTLELWVDGAAAGTDYTFEYDVASSSMTIHINPGMAAAVNYPAQLNATDGRGSSVLIAEWALVVRVLTAAPATAAPTPDRRYTTVPTGRPAVPTIPADVTADTAVTDARNELIDAQNQLNGMTAAYNDYAARYQAGETLSLAERSEMIEMANTDLPNRRRNLASKQTSYDAAIAAADKSTGKTKEAGADMVTVVAIVVIGLVIIGAIIVFVMVQMKKKTMYADGRNFSNPTYDGVSAASPGMGGGSRDCYEHNAPTPQYDDADADVDV